MKLLFTIAAMLCIIALLVWCIGYGGSETLTALVAQ